MNILGGEGLGMETPLGALADEFAYATNEPYADPFDSPDARLIFLLEIEVFPEPGT